MIRKIRNIIFFMIIFIVVLSSITQPVSAVIDITTNIGDQVYLDKGTQGFYTIQKKKTDGNWTYIIYSIIKYKDNNGNEHIAYCLDPDKLGVGYVQGDVDGYEVELTKLISNEKIWRVMINGYPYKTVEELGVETEDDAYLATKMAIYSIVRGYQENDVIENYRAGQKAIGGQKLEDIQRRGEKVITAICNLVNIGNSGTQKIDDELKIVKSSEFEENEENNCYYQKYKVESSVKLSDYTITELLDFPEGTKIVDENGEERTNFTENEEFIVVIDKEKIVEDIEGTIRISAKCKTYPIYYGTAPEGYQDYAVCTGYWNNLHSAIVLKEQKPQEPEIPPQEPIVPEEPKEPEKPEEPEVPIEQEKPQEEPLPRTGEDGVVKSIIYIICIISLSIMIILLCVIKRNDRFVKC